MARKEESFGRDTPFPQALRQTTDLTPCTRVAPDENAAFEIGGRRTTLRLRPAAAARFLGQPAQQRAPRLATSRTRSGTESEGIALPDRSLPHWLRQELRPERRFCERTGASKYFSPKRAEPSRSRSSRLLRPIVQP